MTDWEPIHARDVHAGDTLLWPTADDPRHVDMVVRVQHVSPSTYRMTLREAGEVVVRSRLDLHRTRHMLVFSLQPGQPGEGMTYNVMKRLPYPIHVTEAGRVTHAAPGTYSGTLVGFAEASGYEIAATWDDFLRDPKIAVGKRPVFADEGQTWTLGEPITGVKIPGGVWS